MVFNPRITKSQQAVTLIVRLFAFIVTLVSLLALLLPWIMLDGTREILIPFHPDVSVEELVEV